MEIRLTDKRKKILKVLKTHKSTLSAKDIHQKVPEVDLVTVYRTLNLFVKAKLIHKVLLDTGEVLYEYQKEPHYHAVCSDCERIIHFTAPEAKLKKLLQLENFKIDEVEVTVRGCCK